MDFNNQLLNPGTQLLETSEEYIQIHEHLSKVMFNVKGKMDEIARRGNLDFQINEFRLAEKEKFLGAMVTQFSWKDSHKKNCLEHLKANVNNFLVCLKSDGIRYLLIITSYGSLYFLDRIGNLFEVSVDFDILSLRFLKHRGEPLLIEYIFDGELVFNNTGFATHQKLHFHLFDCILTERKLVIDKNYLERVNFIKSFLAKEKFLSEVLEKSSATCDLIKDINLEEEEGQSMKISLYLKDFFSIANTRFLLTQLSKHKIFDEKIDGLIFTKINYPYYPGRNQGIIKWKPDYLNTADFLAVDTSFFQKSHPELFQNDDFFVFELYCSVGENYILFDYLIIDNLDRYLEIRSQFKEFEIKSEKIDGAIIECSYDKNYRSPKMTKFLELYFEMDYDLISNLIMNSVLAKDNSNDANGISLLLNSMSKRFEEGVREPRGNWKVMRIRTDKIHPNGLITTKNVFNSIFEDNISQEQLLSCIHEGYSKTSNNDMKKVKMSEHSKMDKVIEF